ncbi:MAG: CrcB family protein [Planctomycetota bacterium]
MPYGNHLILGLALAGAGGAGTLARYGIDVLSQSAAAKRLVLGTLLVNLLGSLLYGLVFGLFEARSHWPEPVKLVLLTGFMGAFTTFSTYAFQAVTHARGGQWASTVLHVLAHNAGALALALLGYAVAKHLLSPAGA